MELVNKSEILISQQAPLSLIYQGQILAGDMHRTRGGQVQPTQKI